MKVQDISSFEHHASIVHRGIVLVEYYVSWCSPCRAQASIIDGVADDLNGKASVARLNLDRSRNAAEALRIRSVPTLVVFINGMEVRRFIGLQSRETLTACLAEVIAGVRAP
ncbi:thioredoxin family protein [Desulfococcus sp.]|uniref:thioredoxin family protein n=1 Tax=Desulfococcus sp. TaxID=2025834 RepID=UPI003593F8D5